MKGSIVSAAGSANLERKLRARGCHDHPIRVMTCWAGTLDELSCLFRALAVEGHSELISWSRAGNRSFWGVSKELEVVVESFLGRLPHDCFSTKLAICMPLSLVQRKQGMTLILLSALDDCKVERLQTHLSMKKRGVHRKGRGQSKEAMALSLIGSASFATLRSSNKCADEQSMPSPILHQKVTHRLVEKSCMGEQELLQGACFMFEGLRALERFERLAGLLLHLINNCAFDVWTFPDCINDMHKIAVVH